MDTTVPTESDPLVERKHLRSKTRWQKPKKWWTNTKQRLRSETKVQYKGFQRERKDAQQNISQSAHKIEESSPRMKVKTCEPDSSLIPTIGVTMWLGPHGFVTLVIIDFMIFATTAKRILFVFFFVLALAQPRDKRVRNLKNSSLEATIYVVIAASIYLRAITVFIMAVSIAVPHDFPGEYGIKIGGWICKQAEKYFALKTTLEDEDAIVAVSKQEKAAIFALEPHDIIGYGCFAFGPAIKRLPPGRVRDTMRCLVSSAILNAPIVRNVFSWCLCSPVEKTYFRSYLETGVSFVFVPGGVQEVMLMDPSEPSELVLYLKKRKGFVKMALQYGCPIFPVFCFGLDGSYAYYIPRGDLINKIFRAIGFIPLFFLGRFSIPFGIPRPNQIHVVVGKPIHCPQLGEHVTCEDVDKYHSIFLTELENLFERHKLEEEDYRDRKLKIM